MLSKPRSSEGCWTCRLRRKKCDEARPLCNACATLEIDCLYDEQKPEWMDGGEKQKARVEWLKLEVKRKATQRRERRYLHILENGMESLEVSHLDRTDAEDDSDRASSVPSSIPQATPPDTNSSASSWARASTSEPPTQPAESVEEPYTLMALLASPTGAPLPPNDNNPMGIEERELNMVMLYLDYVFPFLFPFYRPRLLDAGRGWLLVLFSRNKALLHTALSLSSFFFNIVMDHANRWGGKEVGGDQPCVNHNWNELQRQQEIALRELQSEMQRIIGRGVDGYLAETNRVLASVIQLLMFEVAVANSGNWVMHLDAATELFILMFRGHGMQGEEQETMCFVTLLLKLGHIPFAFSPKSHPWSAEQASLRFSTAFLLALDTLSSTTLERAPRLIEYHQHLLTEPDKEMRATFAAQEKEYTFPHINLKEFVGVHNWVILSIGEISALDAWKKERKKTGSLSVAELVSRAAIIECNLRRNIAALDIATEEGQDTDPSKQDLPLIELLSQPSVTQVQLTEMGSWMTRIWGQAIITYLNVVVSGWQPANPEIRSSVSLTIQLLRALPSSSCMRTLVWPVAVSGCMAAPEEEQMFRDLVEAMGPLRSIGTISQALSIMENVWLNRAKIEENPDHWDYASCFNGLGFASLLV